jgi:CHASE1-domain containing sensor protein
VILSVVLPAVMLVVVILIAFAVIGTTRSNPTQDAQDAVARERRAARKAERARRKAERG